MSLKQSELNVTTDIKLPLHQKLAIAKPWVVFDLICVRLASKRTLVFFCLFVFIKSDFFPSITLYKNSFHCINSFSTWKNVLGEIYAPFCRWENWGIDSFNKISHLVNVRELEEEFWISLIWLGCFSHATARFTAGILLKPLEDFLMRKYKEL